MNTQLSTAFLAQPAGQEQVNRIEEAVNGVLDPVVTGFSNVVFFQVGHFPIIVVWLIAGALIFSIYFGFIQFRGFKVALEVVRGKYSNPRDPGEVTHFQALTSAVSGTVGMGNIAGVGAALAMGGPGAAFWMMVAGLLGMCTKFVECTLGVKYRQIDEDGVVNGGPFKYLPIAFARFSSPVAKALTGFFAIAILLFGVAGGGMFQANQTAVQLRDVTGGDGSVLAGPLGGLFMGLVIAAVVGLVIIGGIKSIGRVTDKLVPAMGIFYVVSCLIVIGGNAEHILPALGEILSGAFSLEAGLGGLIGTMIVGFQRAAFSNEAGVGSAPIAHSAVKTRRPVSEGFVALLEPFLDTVVICLMSALTVVIAGGVAYDEGRAYFQETGQAPDGITLVSSAFSTITDWWPILLAIAAMLFAISTLITWAYYGEKAWHYLFGRRKATDTLFRLILMAFIVIGCIASFGTIVDFADAALFCCAFVNILGLYLLMPVVKKEMKEYLADRKSGRLHELGAGDEADLARIRQEQGNA
ncbi:MULTISPECIES: alanine/glycine:cation symporter family protein [Brevibacterium]|uniref:Alanine/glycine:cation symporter family protein n=1 Tax=Brevibacterium salitolerans TaxID=1403566 RepID=A0ABN2WCK8_9MICO|nr:alanine/glycine:cation symporter family protein [Brevibacterium sp.]